MQWTDGVNMERMTVLYSLRDLRRAKGLSQSEIARVLEISKSQYHSIENGKRKPSADVIYKLSLIYKTSMDFIYHAFHRQYVIWHFPDRDLAYAMREAKQIDVEYLCSRTKPISPPSIPESVVLESDFAPYGLYSRSKGSNLNDRIFMAPDTSNDLEGVLRG
jgi:transcriptional regulator with XRE-family HTH domain